MRYKRIYIALFATLLCVRPVLSMPVAIESGRLSGEYLSGEYQYGQDKWKQAYVSVEQHDQELQPEREQGSVQTYDFTPPSTLKGKILDNITGEPVGFVYLHLHELNRSAVSDRDGTFSIENVPVGTYTLSMHRIGYDEKEMRIQIGEEEVVELTIQMQQQAPRELKQEIIVTGTNLPFSGSGIESPSLKITGADLRKELGTTLAETLQMKPGFASRTMGTAPGRPVLRGLGDERLLILQDGQSSADASAFSADHAVTIDPSGSDEIEIARGPSTLIYGSHALGGVINVVKNRISSSVPSRAGGSLHAHTSASATDVSSGSTLTSGGDVTLPAGPMVFHADLQTATQSNIKTPEGFIPNSNSESLSGDVAWSLVKPWGYTGLRIHSSQHSYGIPPDPDGGHPDGVDINMHQTQIESRSEWLLPAEQTVLKLLELRASVSRYNHDEIESSGFIGTSYNLETVSGNLNAKTRPILFFNDGTLGFTAEMQRYEVADQGINNRNTSAALFAVQESSWQRFAFQAGVRLDLSHHQPASETTRPVIGTIASRTFTGLSGSILLTWQIHPNWSAGWTLMRSFRPPGAEELYSRGPHLAVYTYEIGNPNLSAERGWGNDLYLKFALDRFRMKGSAYYNLFSQYIYPRDTGEQSIPNPYINVYQHTGSSASIYGLEAEISADIGSGFVLEGTAGLVKGRRYISSDEQEIRGIGFTEEPLPMMPPLKVQLQALYRWNILTASFRWTRVARQDELAEFETSTGGYSRLDSSLQFRFTDKGMRLHTFVVRVDNLGNTLYRNHLSLVKEIFPEPGRHIRILYKMFF